MSDRRDAVMEVYHDMSLPEALQVDLLALDVRRRLNDSLPVTERLTRVETVELIGMIALYLAEREADCE